MRTIPALPDTLWPMNEAIVNGDTMEKDEDGSFFEVIFENILSSEEMSTEDAEALAARICFAYNACHGIPTDHLVRMLEHGMHFDPPQVPFDPELGF